MGTRSATGVRVGGEDKLSYNQFDGYYEGVGQDVVNELGEFFDNHPSYDDAIGELKQKARTLRMVSCEKGPPPTLQEQKHFVDSGAADLTVSDQSPEDWYCLLRNHQGSILKRLNAGVALDCGDFISNSIGCEFAYVLNLDDEVLEVYKGCHRRTKPKGRYGSAKGNDGYYRGCTLVGVIGLQRLHSGLSIGSLLKQAWPGFQEKVQ